MNHQDQNSGNTELTRSLGRAMHGRVDGIHDAPIGLDQVKGTAGRIRRRRAVASGAAALAAVAIVVPAGLWGADLLRAGDSTPPPATSTTGVVDPTDPTGPATPETPQTPAPPDLADEPIEIFDAAPAGDEPALAYVDAGVLHLPDGSQVVLPHEYVNLVRVGEEYVGARDVDGGEPTVDVLTADGTIVETHQDAWNEVLLSAGVPAFAAWSTPDGTVMTYGADGAAEFATVGRPIRLVGVTGCTTLGADCAFVFRDSDALSGGIVSSDGSVAPLPEGFLDLSAVSRDGIASGLTSGSDQDPGVPVISSLVDLGSGDRLADLTDVRFGYATVRPFSPSGAMIVGERLDTNGSPEALVVFSTVDGSTLVTIVLGDMPEGANIQDATWEDEAHLLVKTTRPGDVLPLYDLFRVGLDGTVERIGEPGHDNGTMTQPWGFVH